MTPDTEEADAPDFDISAAVDQIGAGLGMGAEAKDDAEPAEVDGEDAPETAADEATAPAEAEAAEKPARAFPSSWAPEKRALWDGLSPEVQEQVLLREQQMHDGFNKVRGDVDLGKKMREVFTPYKDMLSAAGVDEAQAAHYLIAAHHKLVTAAPAEKAAYFADLARQYGVDTGAMAQNVGSQVDPTIKALQDQIGMIQNTLSTRDRSAQEAARQKVVSEVEAFAKDPAHPYFDEVADEITAMVRNGDDLAKAYEKAVWANPVTREKELSRLKVEQEKKLRENARLNALKASKAASATVRSRDTNAAPQDPLGSMEETLKDTLASINQRTH